MPIINNSKNVDAQHRHEKVGLIVCEKETQVYTFHIRDSLKIRCAIENLPKIKFPLTMTGDSRNFQTVSWVIWTSGSEQFIEFLTIILISWLRCKTLGVPFPKVQLYCHHSVLSITEAILVQTILGYWNNRF